MSENPTSATKKIWGWAFALSSENFDRIVFVVPWKRLLIIATLGTIILGSLLLIIPKDTHRYLKHLAMVGLLLCWIYLTVLALFTRGELVLDGYNRKVKFSFKSLRKNLKWEKAFEEFEQVRLRQMKDMHGLHNHWKIELLLNDGKMVMIGYGLSGAIRRSSAKRLAQKVATLMCLPVTDFGKSEVG
jgi:hypothetical protein